MTNAQDGAPKEFVNKPTWGLPASLLKKDSGAHRIFPDGHPKLLHLWPVKLLQAGRSDYDYVGVMAMREAASFRR